MASLLGGRNARANTPSIALPTLALSVQTSVQGRSRAIGWGTGMLAGNIIDLEDFRPVLIANNTPGAAGAAGKGGSGGGGGLRGPQASQATYEWTYYATVLISLCEGPITSVNAFTGDGLTLSTYGGGNGGGTLFAGSQTQTASGFMTTNHPANALSYRGEAYLLYAPMFLGSNTTIPNFQYEITFGTHGVGTDFPLDANPRDVAVDFTSNQQYGVAGFPPSLAATMDSYAAWCQANGLVVSPILTDQVEAAQFLMTLAQATYAELKWSGGLLDIIPYGEFWISAHGATYTPPNGGAPDYVLTPDDFLNLQGGDAGSAGSNCPVGTKRKDPQKLINNVRIEYLDRAAGYIPNEIDHKDEASIATTRERPSDVRQNHFFKLASAAAASAGYQLQRERIGNDYYFTLPKHFVLIDLMDLVELPLDHWGEADGPVVVRVKEITENDDRSFTFRAEDYNGAILPPIYARQTNTHSIPDFNADPGAINAPILFEMPAAADPTASMSMLYAAVSGGANYGGADVYASTDGVTYVLADKIKGSARMGVTTNTLPTLGTGIGSDLVDIGDTLNVDLSVSQGVLGGGSLSDMLNRATLCVVGNELIAYELATLTSTYHYSLTPLLRGAYGTAIASHASGAAFARIDGSVARVPFEKARAGTLVYLKFVPFNKYGGGQQGIAGATAYSYRLAGTSLAPEDTKTSSLDTAINNDFVNAVNDFKNTLVASNQTAVTSATVSQVSKTVSDAFQSLASLTFTVNARFGTNEANISINATAIATAQGSIATLQTSVTAQGASITSNTTAIGSLNGSVASINTTLTAQGASITSNTSAIGSLNSSVATINTTLSTQGASITSIQTAQTTDEGNIASIQTTVTAHGVSITSNTSSISTINGNLSGRYTLDIDVNGKIAGFSLINGGGSPSSFDVRVDKFNLWATGYSNTPVFQVSTIGGVAAISINGNKLSDLSVLNGGVANNAITNSGSSTGHTGGNSGSVSFSVRSGSRVVLTAFYAGGDTFASTSYVGGQIDITYNDGTHGDITKSFAVVDSLYGGGNNWFATTCVVALSGVTGGTWTVSARSYAPAHFGFTELPFTVGDTTILVEEFAK